MRGFHGRAAGTVVGDLTNDLGGLLVSSGTRGDGTDGLGDSLVSFIQRGLWNADFVSASLAPDSPLTAGVNELPHWPVTIASGTGTESLSATDTAGASGRVLRLVMNTGAAGDERYHQQIVRVNGSRTRTFSYVVKASVLVPSASNNIAVYVTAQFLKNDRTTTTGVASTTTTAFSAIVTTTDLVTYPASASGITLASVPADAYYLRVRVGIKRNTAATSDSGYIDVTEVRALAFPDDLAVVDQSDPTKNPFRVTKIAGLVAIDSGAGPELLMQTGTVSLGPVGTAVFQMDSVTGIAVANAPWVLDPSTQVIAAATDIIDSNAPAVDISAAAPRTMTSAPTIVDGVDGQELLLLNVGANAITLSDQGTLANSNLRLSTTTFAMGTRDSIRLRYSGTLTDWVEIHRTNVL